MARSNKIFSKSASSWFCQRSQLFLVIYTGCWFGWTTLELFFNSFQKILFSLDVSEPSCNNKTLRKNLVLLYNLIFAIKSYLNGMVLNSLLCEALDLLKSTGSIVFTLLNCFNRHASHQIFQFCWKINPPNQSHFIFFSMKFNSLFYIKNVPNLTSNHCQYS